MHAARRKRDGEVANFWIHYEVDDEEVATVLRLEEHGGEDDFSWVLAPSRAYYLNETPTPRPTATLSTVQ